jgi:hypothetical protein
MSNPMNDARIERIKDYIIEYKQKHDGNSPSNRQISEYMGGLSTSVVGYYLAHLVEIGFLVSLGEPGQARSLEVAGGRWVYVNGM